MSNLRGRLGTNISRGCFQVKAAIATFVVRSRCYLLSCWNVRELLFDSLPRFLSGFDCSFQDRR